MLFQYESQKFGIRIEDIVAKNFIDNTKLVNGNSEETKEYMRNVRDSLIQRNVYEVYRLASLENPELVEKELAKLALGVETDEELKEKGFTFKEKEIEEAEVVEENEILNDKNEIEKEKTWNNGTNLNNHNYEDGNLVKGLGSKAVSGYAASTGLKYVDSVREAVDKANEEMMKTIFNKDGTISQNPNLDGFIFETEHANTFNIDAAIKGKTARAMNLVPKEGLTYGKNSIDNIVMDNNKIVQKYQAKASSTAENTQKLFEKGDYSFQRKLVPKGQAENIKNAMDKISYGGAESKTISKQEIKNMQNEVQSGNIEAVQKSFRNDVDTLAIGKQLAGQSLQAGMYGMMFGTGVSIAEKVVTGKEIDETVIVDGLKAGAGSGLSYAIAGALKIALEKEVITGLGAKILSSNGIIGTIASSAIDIISTVYKLGKDEISLSDAGIEISSSLGCSFITLQTFGTVSTLSAVALTGVTILGVTLTPAIAIVIGTVVGLIVSSMTGNIGKIILKGAGKMVRSISESCVNVVKKGINTVKEVVKTGWETVKSIGNTLWEGTKNLVGSLFD